MTICKICGKYFIDKKHPNKFLCSRKCSAKFRQKQEERNCLICNKVFLVIPSSKVKHCSIQCFNKRPIRNPNMIMVCPICQKEFKRHAGHINQIYCSRKCFIKSHYKTKICPYCKNIFTTKKSKDNKFCSRKCAINYRYIDYVYKIRPSQVLLRKTMNSCEKCNYSKFPQLLERHHKDFNHTNNHKDNLQVLCPNCHDETHFLAKNGLKYQRVK